MLADTGMRDDMVANIAAALEERYRHIAQTAMADVPICNPVLSVAATGFQAWGERAVGVVTTPWFMNLVAIPLPDTEIAAIAAGKSVKLNLPAGEVEFIVGALDGIGRIDSCSLFSPVFEFSSMEEATEVAAEIVRNFFDFAALEPPPPPPPKPSRRDLLRGKFTARPEEVES
jgi:[NiFe] hydrogenase assembly HybE family chaperone